MALQNSKPIVAMSILFLSFMEYEEHEFFSYLLIRKRLIKFVFSIGSYIESILISI